MNELLTPSALEIAAPDLLRFTFTRLNRGQFPDPRIDELLGIPEGDNRAWERELEERYGGERTYYEGTPYERIREILHALKLKAGDVVYDLGCGYGRFIFYGALTTEAQFRGIELVPERVQAARAVKERFAVGNVEIIEGHVASQDFSDGNIFYMFNPFSRETLWQILERLQAISERKPITIVSHYMGNSLDGLPWLRRINQAAHPLLKFYQSTTPLPINVNSHLRPAV